MEILYKSSAPEAVDSEWKSFRLFRLVDGKYEPIEQAEIISAPSFDQSGNIVKIYKPFDQQPLDKSKVDWVRETLAKLEADEANNKLTENKWRRHWTMVGRNLVRDAFRGIEHIYFTRKQITRMRILRAIRK